ncbi:unnamed protein product [Trichogramma brassicae]|uniref:Uncharacterized protein n=1 Tax=Trichogramma brassicae TaxID=86971 RepID=A0A6H5HUS8_9HYME|nr:unnamed protein product [Trichogramma brassicae]
MPAMCDHAADGSEKGDTTIDGVASCRIGVDHDDDVTQHNVEMIMSENLSGECAIEDSLRHGVLGLSAARIMIAGPKVSPWHEYHQLRARGLRTKDRNGRLSTGHTLAGNFMLRARVCACRNSLAANSRLWPAAEVAAESATAPAAAPITSPAKRSTRGRRSAGSKSSPWRRRSSRPSIWRVPSGPSSRLVSESTDQVAEKARGRDGDGEATPGGGRRRRQRRARGPVQRRPRVLGGAHEPPSVEPPASRASSASQPAASATPAAAAPPPDAGQQQRWPPADHGLVLGLELVVRLVGRNGSQAPETGTRSAAVLIQRAALAYVGRAEHEKERRGLAREREHHPYSSRTRTTDREIERSGYPLVVCGLRARNLATHTHTATIRDDDVHLYILRIPTYIYIHTYIYTYLTLATYTQPLSLYSHQHTWFDIIAICTHTLSQTIALYIVPLYIDPTL